jgi:hypothetical protein
MIIIVAINHRCRTVANLLICNTAAGAIMYSIYEITVVSYSLREDWFQNQSGCVFRAYLCAALAMVVSVSYAVHSISRLFHTVLYKHKYLLSWRTHWFLIIINYVLAILGPIPPIFMSNGYVLEPESRLCIPTTKTFYSSMYIVSTVFLIPFSTISIVYGIIFYHARQSTRRVVAFASDRTNNATTNNSTVPNFKREMKLMRNISILVNILACGGTLYLILVLWHVTQRQPPPEPLDLISMTMIAVASAAKMVALFFMSKEIKNIAFAYLRKLGQC